jgi:hypothetical protein
MNLHSARDTGPHGPFRSTPSLVLSARGIRLRPLVASRDFSTLFGFRSDPQYLHLWQLDPRIMPFERYCAYMERMFDTFFDSFMMVERESDEVSLGFVYSYDTQVVDGFTFVCSFVPAKGEGQRTRRNCVHPVP